MNCKIKSKYICLIWLILIIYLYVFSQGYLTALDDYGYRFIASFQSLEMTSTMIAITFFGSTLAVVVICLICIIIKWKMGILVSLNVAFMAIVNQIIKFQVARARPSVLRLVVEESYSFPSAHAMVSLTLFGMIAYLLWNKSKGVSLLLIGLVFLIGISRIYLGVHYVSDVIGGYLFALAYLGTIIPILKYHKILPDT